MSDLNKRIPELAEILAAKSYYQMVIYSPDSLTTYRIDVDKLLLAEAAAFDGYIIYDYTGASGAPQNFTHDKVMVEEAGVIYKLVHPARPYGSVDLAAELAAGHWVAIAGGTGGGATYLNDLLDVTTDTASNGQVLYRSGLNWVNRTLTAADVGALSQATADTLYAPITHNHDGLYAPIDHNHDADYAPITHNHDGLYAPVGHTHAYGLDDLTDVTLASPVNGQVLKLVNGVWTNADETGGASSTGAVLLAPAGAQTINQGTSKFGVNRTGSFFGGNYTQQLIFDEDLFSWRFNTALDSSTYYSRLNVTPYSFLYQAASGANYSTITVSADGSETKAEFSTANSQWLTTTYNSDQYTVMYWTIGDGQLNFDSGNGEWDITAKSTSSATTGVFSVRPNGLYWNNSLLTFGGGGGASTLNDLTDVTITTATTGQTLRYNGTQWVNYALSYSDVGAAAAAHTHAFSSLTGVSIASPTTGQYLQFNGTNWVPTTMSAANLSLDGLNDVTIASVAAGQVVYFNGTQWVNRTLLPSDIGAASNTHNHTLGSLSGVTLSNTTSGQVLTFNGTSWVNSALPVIPTNLDGLSDVVITTPATGQILKYNGTNWVNAAETVASGFLKLQDTDHGFVERSGDKILRLQSNHSSGGNFSTYFQVNGGSGAYTGFSYVPANTALGSTYADNMGWYRLGNDTALEYLFHLKQLTTTWGDTYTRLQSGRDSYGKGGSYWEVKVENKDGATQTGLFRVSPDGLYWNNNLIALGGGGATNLDGLSDVTITTPTSGSTLQYNGTQWVNVPLSSQYLQMDANANQTVDLVGTGGSGTQVIFKRADNTYGAMALGMATRTETTISGSGVRQDLEFNFQNGEYGTGHVGVVGFAGSTTYAFGYDMSFYNNFDGFQNVVFTMGAGTGTGTSGFTWSVDSSTQEVTLTPTGFFLNTKRILTTDDLATAGATNLDGLSDVAIATATSGQVLRHNGTQWVNAVMPDVTTSVSGLMSAADKVKLNTHVRSKTPIALTDAATTNFDLALGYNFTWAISAGNKTINPTNHENGDNWAIDITGCAAQVLSFGPTAGYTHRLAGTTGTVTGVTLPATGTVSLMGRRMGTEIRWSILEF